MINLVLFLGISLPQVSAVSLGGLSARTFDWQEFAEAMACSEETKDTQCCFVAQMWANLTKKYTRVTNAKSCCSILGSTTQSSEIPGVNCSSEGTVRQINWNNQYLAGKISPEIGNLVDLERL